MYRKSPIVENLFDMFRSGSGGAAAQPIVQQQQQQQSSGVIPPKDGTQVVDQITQQQQQQQTGDDANKSPLAEFTELWQNAPIKEGEEVEPDWNDYNSVVPQTKIDPKKLIEAAKRIDFSKAIDPVLVQKALKEGDVAAFNSVINSVLQVSFANMAMSATRITESMTRQMAQKLISKALPHQLRNHSINTQIDTDNPIFTDPAVAPMLEMVKKQMQVKYPKASPAEISSMAKKYVTTFADTVKGDGTGTGTPGKKDGKPGNAGEMDWLDFAGVKQQ
jgi:hypothetical protein